MAKQSGSTYVTAPVVNEDDVAAFAKLRSIAAARLGGDDGLKLVNVNRIGDTLAGTFVREWDDANPGRE
jgi:hypothetical protein